MQTLAFVFVPWLGGWLVATALVFALCNRRWHYTALPRAKFVMVVAAFVLVAVVGAMVSLAILIAKVLFFCTPPNCF